MFKKFKKFIKNYKQLGLVLLSVIVGAALDIIGQDSVAHLVLGISAVANLLPILWGMWNDLRSGSYGLDILAITAVVTSVLLGEYWAGIVIVLMLTGGQALEDYAEKRAKKELTSLLERKPKSANVLRKGKIAKLKLSEINVGDYVLIAPGDVVPVDGVITEGTTSFDESDLTGESLPLTKQVGEEALSGSVNIDGAITIKATHTAQDSQYEQIIKLVRSAAASKAPFVRLADRYSIPFTALAFIIAGATWYVTGDAVRFLEVIVVATPCPLLLGAPIALISGMSRAAKHGIIVKTGSALERLAAVQTMAFDKTGTLTRGVPVVSKIATYNKFTTEEVVSFASALEVNSTHVLAKAVVNYANRENIKIKPAKQVKESSGRGLTGRLQGKTIHVGRLDYLEESGVEIPVIIASKLPQTTSSYVAINNKLAGIISYLDEVRPESKLTLKLLRESGIKHTLMVTGDNQASADLIAKQLGIEDVTANCLPGDKIRAIEYVAHKPVGFVGDGVNDAPVLTASDVGIALGARGSTAASESADVVIMLDDIGKVASGVAIAKRTFTIAKQSILMGILLSIGLMGVFATGRFKPIHGAIIQEFVDIAVILSALRAHGSFKKS